MSPDNEEELEFLIVGVKVIGLESVLVRLGFTISVELKVGMKLGMKLGMEDGVDDGKKECIEDGADDG